jgi:D-proline reductase (dithiol) PrdB
VSLGARQIEEAGIPTVVVGSARDVVEECGVPRFVFVDFPLGNPCGKPYDVAMQRAIVGLALDLLERAFAPRTTVQAPFVWDRGDEGWRDRFMHVGDDNRDELALNGAERRRLQHEGKPAS